MHVRLFGLTFQNKPAKVRISRVKVRIASREGGTDFKDPMTFRTRTFLVRFVVRYNNSA